MGFGYLDADGTVHVTDSAKQGGIVAIYYFGTLIGCFIGGYLGDRIGRINSIGVGSVWAMIGAMLQATAQNAKWMSFARILNGVGTGILNTIVPVWSAETAETKSRGQFIALEFTLNIFGVAAAYWLEYALSSVGAGFSPIRWRVPIAFQIIPLFALSVIIWAFPESPRWLAMDGQDEEALYILQRLRRTDTSEAEDEFHDIVSTVELQRKNSTKISYFEWIGIAGVTVYAPTMFANAGFSTGTSELLSGLNNIFYTLSTIVNVFTIDRIGRRWALYWGAVGQAITMFLAGAFSRYHELNPADACYGGLAATSIFVYTSILAGRLTLYLFALVNILTIPVVWALYPETNQRTLEKIDLLFASNSPWVWDAEKEFERLKSQNPEILHNAQDAPHDAPTV
ncbi:hypothetical protein V1504DRAFT_434244 [Lipomyces starkeyi]